MPGLLAACWLRTTTSTLRASFRCGWELAWLLGEQPCSSWIVARRHSDCCSWLRRSLYRWWVLQLTSAAPIHHRTDSRLHATSKACSRHHSRVWPSSYRSASRRSSKRLIARHSEAFSGWGLFACSWEGTIQWVSELLRKRSELSACLHTRCRGEIDRVQFACRYRSNREGLSRLELRNFPTC